MTIFYGKVNPALQLSSTSNYSDQLLSTAPIETFTATKFIEDLGRTMTANYGQGLSYDLTSWTSIKMIQVTNTGATVLEVDWNTPTGAGAGSDTFAYVSAGRTLIVPVAYPDTAIFGAAGSVIIWCVDPALPGSANVTILGT